MALIVPPAPMPLRQIMWKPGTTRQINRSGWTGRRQVSGTPGPAIWTCSAEFVPVIGQAAAKKWRGFFTALDGPVNHFPVIAVEAAQHGGANPTVVSGAAGANTLTLSAALPALGIGDFLTVRLADGKYQLVMLTAPMAGTTATFMPPLRAAASTGAGSVETRFPFAHVTLPGEWEGWDVSAGQTYGFAFSAEEYL